MSQKPDEEGFDGPEDLRELMKRLLGGLGGGMGDLSNILPDGVGGMPDIEQLLGSFDSSMVQQLFAGFSKMFGDPWENALRQARHVAGQHGRSVTETEKGDYAQAVALAELWLSDATVLPEIGATPELLTRAQWAEQTIEVWKSVVSPVSDSIADVLGSTLRDQGPEEAQAMLSGLDPIVRGIGQMAIAGQFGTVLGKLSTEVISGSDVSIPVLPAGTAALVPQNVGDFADGLDVSADQVRLYVAARELAAARLHKHAKWLGLQVLSQIGDFARGIEVDVAALEDMARQFDPQDLEQLQSALESGALAPTQSEAQRAALARLETLIAIIDGWVQVVAEDALKRVPDAGRLTEAIRRRRAAGGPAEEALGALVGLNLRPRRLREAAEMWRQVGDELGIEARDALWDYPDLIPTSEDIDAPAQLIARLRGGASEPDAFDVALEQLLNEAEASDAESGEPDDTGESGKEPGNPETSV